MAVTQATLNDFDSSPGQRPTELQDSFETLTRERLAIAARKRHRQRFWSEHDREDYTCPMCGYEAKGLPREFDVHHIDRDWLNGHIFNLVAICSPCHRRVHKLITRERALEQWKTGFVELGD